MTIIAPSLLSCDFVNIESEIKKFKVIDNLWFHLDIMDGHFVPNMTFGPPIIKRIVESTTIPCDAHFMVTNPEFYIENLKDVPLKNFTFHYEATEDVIGLIKQAKQYFPSVGVSIKPGTSVDVLTDEILKELDLVLIMSVEPGFGGQSFIESTLEKVKTLKEKKAELNFQIQIDGGISDKNSKAVKEVGVDNLVAGSFVFKGEDVNEQVKKLLE